MKKETRDPKADSQTKSNSMFPKETVAPPKEMIDPIEIGLQTETDLVEIPEKAIQAKASAFQVPNPAMKKERTFPEVEVKILHKDLPKKNGAKVEQVNNPEAPRPSLLLTKRKRVLTEAQSLPMVKNLGEEILPKIQAEVLDLHPAKERGELIPPVDPTEAQNLQPLFQRNDPAKSKIKLEKQVHLQVQKKQPEAIGLFQNPKALPRTDFRLKNIDKIDTL